MSKNKVGFKKTIPAGILNFLASGEHEEVEFKTSLKSRSLSR
jgi:hypothetical protein